MTEDDRKMVNDFRAKLKDRDMSLKDFVIKYNLDYQMFNQAINRLRPLRIEYVEAISKFMEV